MGRSLAIGLQDAIVDAVEAKLKLLHALPAPVVTKPAPDDD